MEKILKQIKAERIRQVRKFGDQTDLGPFVLLAVLSEEVGEASEAALRMAIEGGKTITDFRTELIQAATVAVQMVEIIDSRRWDKHHCNQKKTNNGRIP